MSCIQTFPKVTRLLQAHDSTATPFFQPYTEWVHCTGLDAVRAVLTMRNMIETLSVKPAYQFAVVRPDKPSAPTSFGTAHITNGEFFEQLATLGGAGKSPDNFWVRFGVEFVVGASNGDAQAEVSLEVTAQRCGTLLGGKALQLRSRAGNTGSKYVAVTKWHPTVAIAKAKALAIVGSVEETKSASFEFGFCYRTAATDRLAPNGWQSLGVIKAPSGNEERFLADTAVTVGNNEWVQFGVLYRNAVGGSDAQASVRCALAASS